MPANPLGVALRGRRAGLPSVNLKVRADRT